MAKPAGKPSAPVTSSARHIGEDHFLRPAVRHSKRAFNLDQDRETQAPARIAVEHFGDARGVRKRDRLRFSVAWVIAGHEKLDLHAVFGVAPEFLLPENGGT